MRILLVSSFFPPDRGGVPVHAAALLREFRARGHEVAVFRRVSDEGEEYALERRDEGSLRVHAVRYRWRDTRSFDRTYLLPEIDARFGEVLESERPDVVHALHLSGLGLGLPLLARARGVPFVLTLNDYWIGCPRSQRITRDLDLCPRIDRTKCLPCLRDLVGELLPAGENGLETLARYDEAVREALLSCSKLVAPSRHTRGVHEAQGIPADRIAVVPPGIDPAPFAGAARTAGDRFRIAYLGSVMWTKGAHVLLEAVRSLPPARYEVAVHGEEIPWHEVRDYGARLRALVRPGDPVTFTGAYTPDQVPRLLAAADCLVVPSVWFETYSITIREGWHAGVPVVASRLGAMEEAIEDGVTGLLFRPGDAHDLARKLRALLDDPALRVKLARAPKPFATAAETAERLLDLYRALR